MACAHPVEERQRVYDGTAEPRPDRSFCSLCGLVVYEAVRERVARKIPRYPNANFTCADVDGSMR